MSTPNPSIMARFTKPVSAPTTAVVADVQPEQRAKIVRPGPTHDGVVKAKQLKEGMKVRAFLHGQPRGGERVVKSVEKIDDGAMVRVTFSSAHPPADYKAAYRFHCEALVREPAFVAYEEV